MSRMEAVSGQEETERGSNGHSHDAVCLDLYSCLAMFILW